MEASDACKADRVDGLSGTLLRPSLLVESTVALAYATNVWRVQVTLRSKLQMHYIIQL